MPQNLRGRRFGYNLLIRGGLRAYALTLPLLGFECTWYEIKSRQGWATCRIVAQKCDRAIKLCDRRIWEN